MFLLKPHPLLVCHCPLCLSICKIRPGIHEPHSFCRGILSAVDAMHEGPEVPSVVEVFRMV